MDKVAKNLLVTGVPGIGKSTLIKKLAEELEAVRPVGFYTEEIRVDGTRKGFRLVSLDGRRRNLAHTDARSQLMVGKYRVNVRGFDDFLDALDLTGSGNRLVILDEIGRMECLSQKFRRTLRELLDQDRLVIATVAQNGGGAIEAVKERDDIVLFQMDRRNRHDIAGKLLRRVRLIRFS